MVDAAHEDCLLMQRVRTGDRQAFARLVTKYASVLLNFFLRKGVSYDDGQDLAQRTFLRVWRYREKYTPQAKWTTFMFLLAGQEAIDFYRSQARRKNLMEGYEAAQVLAPTGPDRVQIERGLRVRQAVSKLPPALRDVVELGVFQDLPYAEVSTILNIPVGTVKSRMWTGIRKLKEVLG